MENIKEEVMKETRFLIRKLVSGLKQDLVQTIKKELERNSSMVQFEDQGNLFKSGEAAKKLGISTRTLNRWRDSGKINPIRRNGLCYYSEKEINQINQGGFSNRDFKVQPETVKRNKSGRKSNFSLANL